MKDRLLTLALAIYVVVLMAAAVDELFDLGLFPPELERQISQHIKELKGPDPLVQQAAAKWLVEEGHQFAVRQLIHELKRPDMKPKVAPILAQICQELDLEAQAKNAVTRLADNDAQTREEAAWELMEIGHFGLPAILKAMRHPRTDIRARLRRAIVQTTAMYFDSDAWKAEALDAQMADLAQQLANPALAAAAAEKLKAQRHFALPRLITALYQPQLRPKAAEVLSGLLGAKPGAGLAAYEEAYVKWWESWYAKEKDKLGFGDDYAKWKLWYRMNKDHL